MPQDGGVQDKLDSAKSTLNDIATKSNVSPKQSPYAPPPTSTPKPQYPVARAARTNTGDELAEKKKNVEQYAASQ